ncbi:MAG TPA: DEAD/DEAH box helicase [Polyangia bacterium]|nr:DEAD/DEAH box helicase [Polyangia bacterium]
MFSELGLVPALAEAVDARGYQTATPVQVAVLEAKVQGRDLLVSSQTGSGKTLAFGSLIAQTLLEAPAPATEDGQEAARPARRVRRPGALIVAPTRELANQVRAELAWLFARTPLSVAAFTGGSDIRRDLKILHAGADLVVGTPGRLVDLLSRKALHLEEVKAVVVDEADEMLDMGFHEDLETILGAATARTCTHMFSATLPQPILALAARYQKDAARIDARSLGEAPAHEDIRHVAYLTAMGDRGKAVVNVLRHNPDQRAIVFGTTREGVADLHRELVRQGFRAVVLSGDRAQAERNRALAALRAGEAQILVATNVAARGLDLPEVDLVVHADLPLNGEALTHRSGRTGRAGRKGTSVLIASLAERRKAERLLGYAKVEFSWANAPGAKEIRTQGEKRLEDTLRTEAATEPSAAASAMVERLSADIPQDRLLLLLLDRELERLPKGEVLRPVDTHVFKSTDSFRRDSGPPVSHADFSRDAVVFRVNLGAESKAEPGWLLPLICRRGGVTRREVGAIRVGPQHSEFEIAGEAAKDFALAASQTDPRAPHVHMEVAGHTIGRPPAREAHAKPERHGSRPPRSRDADMERRPPGPVGNVQRSFLPARERGKPASQPLPAQATDGNSSPLRFERRPGAPHASGKAFAKPNPRPHAAAPQVRFGGSHRAEPSGGFAKGPSFSRPGRPAPIPAAKHKWHPKPGKRSPPR